MDYVASLTLDIVHEPRTYQMGIRKARQKGLTEQLDIHNGALLLKVAMKVRMAGYGLVSQAANL